MRVIGGKCKGRRLASFSGSSIRPTSDKVREAIYNILPMEFPFRRVLDLFAGTGAMGIEALSRGADEAVFVDSSLIAINIIRKNLESCGLEGASVHRGEAVSEVRRFARGGEHFDLIIIDPPYNSALVEETLKEIDTEGLLAPGGIIVAEASKRAPVKNEFPGLELEDERKYGDTLVYFFGKRG
ncbi:MAG: 16S rRNA (guanine(966)-N(2))-methyltransferase RsmD [Deltaproteobacteria bacterium]|nr:16S rRNA (guanine(966)-N(2))-methyltransferase RsmD [Deltaproteobacteria bacterium]